MLIKEYRIALPLTVDEYRIAQLYMIAKKSRDESSGAGSGVEILVNEPYTDGPGGAGQYTHKIFHVGNRLPGWLKALLPKSALIVYEKAWNAYPYTKTRYTCPFVEKFFLEIETKYLNDPGNHENIFELSGSDLRSRIVDVIDVVKEHPHGEEYKTEEDPRSYVSQKTGRGPLCDSWMEDYWSACRDKPTPLPDGRAIMCAYKLCRVEFKYWGMQSKIERFIHDVALRKTMLEAHRQAWAWQDEWWGLTMDDIRRLEKETQEALARTMAAATQAGSAEVGEEGSDRAKTDTASSAGGAGGSGGGAGGGSGNDANAGSIEYAVQDSASRLSCSWSPANSPRRPRKPRDLNLGGGSADADPDTYSNTSADVRPRIWSRSNSRAGLHSPGCSSNKSFDLQLANWRMEGCVTHSDSSSDDEFFDCEGPHLPSPSPEDIDTRSTLTKWSSLEFFNEDENTSPSVEYFKEDSIFKSSFAQRVASAEPSQVRSDRRAPSVSTSASLDLDPSLPCSPALSPSHHLHPHNHPSHQHLLHHPQPCPTTVLLLVLHGGSILDSVVELATKKSDVSTFRTALEGVAKQHYPGMAGHVTVRLVACPHICQEALGILSSLSPYSFDASSSPFTFDGGSAGNTSTGVQDFIPVSAIPLFATASIEYNEIVSRVIAATNQVYHDFLRSEAGAGFHGQVALLGDSVGSVVAYDALCRPNQYGRFGSDSSIPEADAPHSPGGPHSKDSNPLISISDGGDHEADGGRAVFAFSAATPSHPPPPPAPSTGAHSVSGDPHAHLTAPHFRRRSSCSSEQSHVSKFDFDVSDFFMFGSPVAMVMAFRKIHTFDDKNTTPPRPVCNQVYNLFHPMDPLAARLEPLISARFAMLQPVKVARYAKYPLGDGQPCHLLECIQSNAHHFVEYVGGACPATPNYNRRMSEASMQSIVSGVVESVPLQAVSALTQKWWGNKRLDYALYCPEGLTNFPVNALPHLFHASYWESSDVIAFILRQVSRSDSGLHRGDSDKDGGNFIPSQPREKWMKKRTSMKLKNVNANHRANDVIIKEGVSQVLNARFMYGPLDMVTLTGEKVDIHIMKDPPSGEWTFLGTEVTDNSGRLKHVIPDNKAFGYGMYPIKMVVRGDHTSVDFYLVVIPPKTECVVFSIDGSFTASVSVTGRDPKVRAGAVDVVRHWQELGYLIVYVTGRPDMQQQKVVSWLAQHNFPRGLLSFVDGFCTDPLRHKADYLRHLVHDADVAIHASYGSSKDISMYTAIGLKPDQIFIVGKASKKQHAQAQILSDGYAAHLSDLLVHGGSRQALGNARMVIPRGCFGLPGQMIGLRRRRSAKRTTSFPMAAAQGPVPLVEAILRPRGTSPRPSTISVTSAAPARG